MRNEEATKGTNQGKKPEESAHPDEVLAGLQAVHEILGVDVDVRVQDVQPLGQVLLHGVEVLVGARELAEAALAFDELHRRGAVEVAVVVAIVGVVALATCIARGCGGDVDAPPSLLQAVLELSLELHPLVMVVGGVAALDGEYLLFQMDELVRVWRQLVVAVGPAGLAVLAVDEHQRLHAAGHLAQGWQE